MTEGDQHPEAARLTAWARELREVHERLRAALRTTRDAATSGSGDLATRDLLVFCHGFCAALTGHHEGEDTRLFPAIATAHPALASTLHALEQDHAAIAGLVTALQSALDSGETASSLDRHLDGIAAIMESHFRYEERALLGVLETLALDAGVEEVLGPL